MAFHARLIGTVGNSSDDLGIFRGDGAALTQIAREGQPGPDADGTLSILYSTVARNDAGATAFEAKRSGSAGGSSDGDGVFRGDEATLEQIARAGQTAPDGNGELASPLDLALNDAGAVAFEASLSGTAGGSSDDQGIFRGGGAALVQIARKGQTPPDGNGAFLDFSSPALNGAGQTAFQAALADAPGGSRSGTGIFLDDGATLIQVARTGQPAPDGNGTLFTLIGPALNDAGQTAFWASLAGTAAGHADSEGIFRSDGATLVQIARAGQPSPDGNGAFSYFDPEGAALNNAGQVAFWGQLVGSSGGSSDDRGLFRGDGATLDQIVREGQAVPDGNGTFGTFDYPVLNDAGATLFSSFLLGTSGGEADNVGLFLADPQEILQVARDGQDLEGSTIASLDFLGGPDPGGRSSLNEFGQVAYWATLADGREGVFLFTPELHWRSAESGSWDMNGHWTVGLPPAEPHDVFIDPAAGVDVTGPAADTRIASLTLGATASGIASLHTGSGGSLTIANAFDIGPRGHLDHQGGALSAGAIHNAGTVEFAGGNSDILGAVANDGMLRITDTAATFFDPVANSDGGTIENRGGAARFLGGLANSGAYLSGAADNEFADITLEETGYLVGGAGDRFLVSGDFLSTSQMLGDWDTLAAELVFEGGSAHTLRYTGADLGRSALGFAENFAWGVLALGTGESLVLEDGDATPGGAVYVGVLALTDGLPQVGSITGNGLSLYYDPLQLENAYLGGGAYALPGGGWIAPVPEPATALIFGLGLAGLACIRRRTIG